MDENNLNNVDRRKRINRLKKIILTTAFVMIIIPIIMCIFLSLRVCSLENRVDDLINVINATNSKEVNNEVSNNTASKADSDQIDADISDSNNTNVKDKSDSKDNESDEAANSDANNNSNKNDELKGKGKRIYLTFDDGPSENTAKIIEILDKYNVKATFFVIGHDDEESMSRYKMIVESGNAIGLHSYSHDYSSVYKSLKSFKKEVNKVHDVVKEATGIDTRLFRFPGGSYNSVSDKVDIHECIEFLNEEGYTYFDWNISSCDAGKKVLPVKQIMKNIEKDLYKYDDGIILMHDSSLYPTTVEALPGLIEKLLAEGFEIKAIDYSTPLIQQIKSN